MHKMEYNHYTLTKKQREELKGYVSFFAYLGRAILFLSAVFIIEAVFQTLQKLIYDPYPFWVGPTILAALFIFSYSKKWTGGAKLRRNIRRDLYEGKVQGLIINPSYITEVEEGEDEGPSYIIETTCGQHILFTGQYLDRLKAKGFPWTKFEITEAPYSKLFFNLKKLGKSMKANSTRVPFSYKLARKLGCFDNDYIVLTQDKTELIKTP